MRTISRLLILSTFLVTAATMQAQPRLTENNIDKVIKAMTLEEKAQLLVGAIDGTGYEGVPTATGEVSQKERLPGAAGQTNAISRLGIPSTVLADGPAGLRMLPHRPGDQNDYYCTGFPVGIVLASTWNVSLKS